MEISACFPLLWWKEQMKVSKNIEDKQFTMVVYFTRQQQNSNSFQAHRIVTKGDHIQGHKIIWRDTREKHILWQGLGITWVHAILGVNEWSSDFLFKNCFKCIVCHSGKLSWFSPSTVWTLGTEHSIDAKHLYPPSYLSPNEEVFLSAHGFFSQGWANEYILLVNRSPVFCVRKRNWK